MKRELNRSVPFWILLAVSVALVATGALVALDHLGTMTATLKNGSATGLEVYAGQSWIVIGAALMGAGVLGVLLTLALTVVSGLLPATAAQPEEIRPSIDEDPVDEEPESVIDEDEDAQNGSSGSTATATKISVK